MTGLWSNTACALQSVGLAVILMTTPLSSAPLSAQQSSSLRPTPQHVSSPFLLRPSQPRDSSLKPNISWRTSSTTRGALIGGGIGLVLSSLATLLYVEGTDSGNYSGPVVPILMGATAIGAVIGAAIGAGWTE